MAYKSVITLPDPLNPIMLNSPMTRKTTLVIKGPNFDSVYHSWQELLGYLPLVLIFDLSRRTRVRYTLNYPADGSPKSAHFDQTEGQTE